MNKEKKLDIFSDHVYLVSDNESVFISCNNI